MSLLLKQKIYATFDEKGSKRLSGHCFELLSEQMETWPDLRKGRDSLKDVRERDISCRGFSVRLQYNPGRLKSSTADVTPKKRNGQRCFLCLDQLPEDQKGILYRNDFLILCNPMPILSPHFTISYADHCRPAITENIDTLLHLVADFGSGWTVLYNGPKCGASAPDHLHFQAVPSGQLPVEMEMCGRNRLILMAQVDGVLLYRVKEMGREVVVLEGEDPTAVGSAFKGFLSALKEVLLIDEEPMINIAGFQEGRKWRLLIFPRRKHRPDSFFSEGDARVVVSPGVVDMGGVLVTPMEKDFEGLDAAGVESIYREVSLEGTAVETAIRLSESILRPPCRTGASRLGRE